MLSRLMHLYNQLAAFDNTSPVKHMARAFCGKDTFSAPAELCVPEAPKVKTKINQHTSRLAQSGHNTFELSLLAHTGKQHGKNTHAKASEPGRPA